MAQNVEEGLRQQAVNRAQRVKKPMQSNFSQLHGSSMTSDDGSPMRVTDISLSAADNGQSGYQLPGDSRITEGSCSVLSAEIELVMRPHPQLDKRDVYDSQTRFIKTTSNATGIDDAACSLVVCLVVK